jgi:hypothetical protein
MQILIPSHLIPQKKTKQIEKLQESTKKKKKIQTTVVKVEGTAEPISSFKDNQIKMQYLYI